MTRFHCNFLFYFKFLFLFLGYFSLQRICEKKKNYCTFFFSLCLPLFFPPDFVFVLKIMYGWFYESSQVLVSCFVKLKNSLIVINYNWKLWESCSMHTVALFFFLKRNIKKYKIMKTRKLVLKLVCLTRQNPRLYAIENSTF